MRIVITLCFLGAALTVSGAEEAKEVPNEFLYLPSEADRNFVKEVLYKDETFNKKVAEIEGFVTNNPKKKDAIWNAVNDELQLMFSKYKEAKCNTKGGLKIEEDMSPPDFGIMNMAFDSSWKTELEPDQWDCEIASYAQDGISTIASYIVENNPERKAAIMEQYMHLMAFLIKKFTGVPGEWHMLWKRHFGYVILNATGAGLSPGIHVEEVGPKGISFEDIKKKLKSNMSRYVLFGDHLCEDHSPAQFSRVFLFGWIGPDVSVLNGMRFKSTHWFIVKDIAVSDSGFYSNVTDIDVNRICTE